MTVRIVLAWSAAALCVAALVLVVWVDGLVTAPVRGGGEPGAAALALAYALTGALLVTARPRNWVGWLLVLIGVLQAAANAGGSYGSYGVGIAHPAWPAANWVAEFSSMVWLPSVVVPATVLMALYPTGHLPSPRWWAPVTAVVVGLLVLTAGATFSQDAYDDIAPGPAPFVLSGSGWASVAVDACAALLLVGGAVSIWVGTGVRLVNARAPERQQLAWYVGVVVPLVLAWFFLPLPEVVFFAVGFGIPVAVVVGVSRYQLLGIVLRPALVYGSLTAAVVGVYLAVTALAGSSTDRGPIPGVIAAGLVAVGITPMRDRLQRAVDRFVYGERHDPLRAVTLLGESVSTQAELLPAVLATVTAATRAPAAAVLDADGQLLAGELVEPSECMPLRVGGEPVGTLRLTWRSPTTPYANADRKLLEALIPPVAVVVCALDLAEALESERDRVVAVTRSERDRFRRDLHDGLGPSLSGIGLGLQVASDALEARDVAAADRMVAASREEIARLVEEVRRIIDDLRPAALDQFGLVEALRRHADSLAPGVPVEVRVTALPAIRPAVEIAAYRIVREALTNIVRHAEATGATVDLAADGSDLLISVTDDGRGHAAERTEGVGMPSMRRRAEALGGTLDTSGGRQGTTVTARLPLEAIP